MSVSPAELLEVAVTAARAGGAVLAEGLGKTVHVDHKSERTSIVTDTDRAAQHAIVEVITAYDSHHAILGEEGRAGAAESSHTWLVDPLDGTSNYAHGVPLACTSVAVRDADGVAAAAIFEPFRGELFTAARGGGAWIGGRRLQVSTTATLDQALICTGVQSDDPRAVVEFGQRITELAGRCRGVRCIGSPALCLAYVAAGRVDAFLEADSTYAWDVGAGSLLIDEAGGRIEAFGGGPLNLGPGLANVLATNGRIHDALATLVR